MGPLVNRYEKPRLTNSGVRMENLQWEGVIMYHFGDQITLGGRMVLVILVREKV